MCFVGGREAKVSLAQHLEVQRVPTSKPGRQVKRDNRCGAEGSMQTCWVGTGRCWVNARRSGLRTPQHLHLRQNVLQGSQASRSIHLARTSPVGSWAACPTSAELLTVHWAAPTQEPMALNCRPETHSIAGRSPEPGLKGIDGGLSGGPHLHLAQIITRHRVSRRVTSLFMQNVMERKSNRCRKCHCKNKLLNP